MSGEISPEELLAAGRRDGDSIVEDHLVSTSWHVRWDRLSTGDVQAALNEALPSTIGFRTSGSTGTPRTWSRSRDSLLAEARMLASLAGSPAAFLSFAPPRHLFGTLTSIIVPALLKIPVYYVPRFTDDLPRPAGLRWGVGAIPWSFAILRRARWGMEAEQVTVLHSTAILPPAAREYQAEVGSHKVRIVEIFGSTETGGVARRVAEAGDTPWQLLDDVEFATGDRGSADDVSLSVRSPRLAVPQYGVPLPCWHMDDQVQIVDDRRFLFQGRRSSLVNVNGRRLSLDYLDHEFRKWINCADLACVPVADDVRGEHFDLHVVTEKGTGSARVDLDAVSRQVGIRPRSLRYVDAIARTGTGKIRRIVER